MRLPFRSKNKRLVQVSEEHCGDLMERYFTTLDRVQEEYGDYYDGPVDWSREDDREYGSLTDDVKRYGTTNLETKYRFIVVTAVDPENPKAVLSPVAEYRDNDLDWIEDYRIPQYLEEDEDYDHSSDIVNITDEELRYLGHSDEEIAQIRSEWSKGNYKPQIVAYKEVWDPRQTPEEIHPKLVELGIPRKYWDPKVNGYGGSIRGSFGRRRRR